MLILPGLLVSTGMFAATPIKYLFIGRMTWYLMTLMFIMEKSSGFTQYLLLQMKELSISIFII